MTSSASHADRPQTQPGLISVIIPTYRRYDELRRAAQSSVDQTYPHVEVIVVADGPDPLARDAVAGLGPRLHYFELPQNAGPAAARNFGVAQSHGEWLTFLDDDDTMLPERLARQITQLNPAEPHCMSACRMIYRHGSREDIWPARPLAPGEDVGDYLLIRPSLLGRPGVLSLQSLVMHHTVVRQAPLTDHADHEDWAWLLEAWHIAGARVHFLWEPLVSYNIATESTTRSRRTNWQDSLDWAMQYRKWLSKSAFNSFLASKVALKAKRAGSRQGLRQLFRLIVSNKPRALDLLFFFSICLVPNALAHHAWKRSLRAS
jgi:glycosyltransferase involved in cell wall biosynthesis